MLKLKIYKYDSTQETNGYRGQDLSEHLLQPPEITEDITQELDTAEITLVGLPTAEEFTPESKFIIDIVEVVDGFENIVSPQPLHFCVSRDIVEKPILSDNSYFNHHISLIEPSVVAQKRLVDNIATTYKLKDVTLEFQASYPAIQAAMNLKSARKIPDENFGEVVVSEQSGLGYTLRQVQFSSGKYFALETPLYFVDPNGSMHDSMYNDIETYADGNGGYKVAFRVPKVAIMFGDAGAKTFSKIGYASVDCTVEEFELNDTANALNTWTFSIISTSNLGNGTFSTLNGWQDRVTTSSGSWLLEKVEAQREPLTSIDSLLCYYKKYSTGEGGAEPSYLTPYINIQADKKYRVTITLHNFDDNLYIENRPKWSKYNDSQPSYFVSTINTTQQVAGLGELYIQITERPTFKGMTFENNTASTFLITYSVDTGTIVYASSTPYSALSLLQKAIINSAVYEKKDNVYIGDINGSDLPFVIDTNYVDKLAGTRIIENFYNQKNLWEIMLEVGHYIHAIPELRFAEDDKFLITFNELGRTDQHSNNGTKVSIFNSRSVEDYISATSSYVSNMVQLGGTIEEWVSPKTTNEQLLVYNDTVEILTSKPIIELLEIQVKCNVNTYASLGITQGEVADMTEYVFEENVYKTLGLDYDTVPNRGLALYYQLGKNVITGCNFQLPYSSYNIYADYAIKKIIYSAYLGYYIHNNNTLPDLGYWDTIQVNDFSFFIKYRTKDSVRQNHVRPDLRKYLLNSKYDKIPEHNQFNNQTDVVVDSLKFGNNIYGKLIKTGNSNIMETEWNDDIANVKHKGELYIINGKRYYVAKVTHYYYSSYIESTIEYSEDYNELSQVIGIPSEPRFYEISEQSLIWREFAINDTLLLTDNIDGNQIELNSFGPSSNYVFDYTHLKDLIFTAGSDFAKYALSVYKGDKDTPVYEQAVGEPDLYKEVLNPINAYASENTLTYEWDMVDNYSAGDKVIDTQKTNYKSLRAVGYTDIYGKAALYDFYILGDVDNLSSTDIEALPESPISTKPDDPNGRDYVGDYDILATNVYNPDTNYNGRGIGLLKDCREAMSINYNLQLITSSDTFILSPFIFLPNKTNVVAVLLSEEVNKLSDGYIDNSAIITPYDTNGDLMVSPYFSVSATPINTTNDWGKTVAKAFSITINGLSNVNQAHFEDTEGYQRIKAIAILCNVPINPTDGVTNADIPYRSQFVLARNIPSDWTKARINLPLYMGAPAKDYVFTNKQ